MQVLEEYLCFHLFVFVPLLNTVNSILLLLMCIEVSKLIEHVIDPRLSSTLHFLVVGSGACK